MSERRSSPAFAGRDARPRIHLWRSRGGWSHSTGPAWPRSPAYATAGRALDAALTDELDGRFGIVVLVEPTHG